MEVEFDKLLTTKWQKFPYWYGNPDLRYECWGKKYNKSYGTYKVYIFGKKDRGKNTPCFDYTNKDPERGFWDESTKYIKEFKDFSDWNYVVRGLYSNTFDFTKPLPQSGEEACEMLDEIFKTKKIY